MKVGLDATPLLGRRSGIGTYTARLVDELAATPGLDLVLAPVTVRGHRPDDLPPGARWRHRPVPARAVRRAWQAGVPFPTTELLAGRLDVYHGTNFVLPPSLRAGGVVTVHDLSFLRHADAVDATSLAYVQLVPRAVRRARRVITPSEAVRQEVIAEYSCPPGQVVAVPHGVDPGWASATPLADAEREALGIPERYVVFVGNLEPRKNLAWLVRAHRAAVAQQPDTPALVLCGQLGWGPAEDLAGTVRPGYLETATLRRVVAGAQALVLPTRYEGFGMPVLEAQAAGTPVLCTDLPVLREVGGPQAHYLPLDDDDALADALTRADRDADPAATTLARDRATGFTWAASAAAHLDAYTAARR